MIRFLILWHERTGIDGGTLRSTQILELTRSLSTDVTRLAYTPWSSAGLGHRLRALATGLRHLAAHGSLHPRTLYYFGDTHLTLARFGPVDVLLFEPMAGLAQPVAAAAQPWCRTLVAALHNVEALVYSDPPARTRRTCDLSRRIGELQRELRGCQECDVILTPSRTDEQILALFNMSSIFLPYQAPGERAEALDRIRRERLEPAKDTILVIGSSGNLPTFEGIRQQIEWLAGQAWVSLPPVVCVGAGTERLRPVAPEGVQILGRVDDDALRSLLLRARCIWVHQPPTTGQLNRISDALCAGIPVVANIWAARGFEGVSGVHIYRSFNEALHLLSRKNLEAPTEMDHEQIKVCLHEASENFKEMVYSRREASAQQ